MKTNVRRSSLDAYDQLRASGALTGQQHTIMVALHLASGKDWTLQEICRLTGLAINATSGRCNELKAKGYLEECERRPCSVTKRRVVPLRIRVPRVQGDLFQAAA